jgi:two-component system, sensor histidine kinase PdtaS
MAPLGRILIVDDDPALQAIARRTLQSAGFDTQVADNGPSALLLARSYRPDLMLLDVNMPEMDGFEVCQRIKSDPETRSIYVLILSALVVDTDSKVQGLSIGADGYIERPVANRELVARVQALMRIRSAEIALQDSLKQWQATFDAVQDAIFLTDIDFTVLRCNRAAAQLFRVPIAEIIGRKCYEIVHGTEDRYSLCPLLQIKEQGKREIILLNYNNRWIQASVDPVIDAAGEFSGSVHVLTDVTDRILAEENLRRSEENYRQLFEAESDAIFLIDNENGKILQANSAASSLYGYTREEIINLKNSDLSAEPDETRRRTEEFHAEGEEVIAIPLRYHRKKDGSVFPVEITGRFFIHGDRRVHIAAIRDITQRQMTEQEIKTALAEKETLLRELYHRTKNNMQVISAMLSLQKSYSDNPLVGRILTEMDNRIQSMAMVHQKLYQSRNLSSIDLGEFLTELALLLEQSLKVNPDITLILDMDSVAVLIDLAIPCGLMLNELVSNALKYAFPLGTRGEITVTLRMDAENTIHLRVSDNGVGLPAGFRPREDGRLGLQTLFALVEHQLQGTIEFTSGPGLSADMVFKNNPNIAHS